MIASSPLELLRGPTSLDAMNDSPCLQCGRLTRQARRLKIRARLWTDGTNFPLFPVISGTFIFPTSLCCRSIAEALGGNGRTISTGLGCCLCGSVAGQRSAIHGASTKTLRSAWRCHGRLARSEKRCGAFRLHQWRSNARHRVRDSFGFRPGPRAVIGATSPLLGLYRRAADDCLPAQSSRRRSNVSPVKQLGTSNVLASAAGTRSLAYPESSV